MVVTTLKMPKSSFARNIKRIKKLYPTGNGKHLTKTQKSDVKKIVVRSAAKSVAHNGAGAGTTGFTYAFSNFWANIQTLTTINQGLNEYNRRGDQIWIDAIHIRAYLSTTSSNDAVRLVVARQKSTGVVPTSINPNTIFQNVTPGAIGLVTEYQDDRNVQILKDRTYTLGIAAGLQECRVVNLTMRFKRPLKCVYYDGTVAGSSVNTLIGDIALLATSVQGTAVMEYVYSVTFHEK